MNQTLLYRDPAGPHAQAFANKAATCASPGAHMLINEQLDEPVDWFPRYVRHIGIERGDAGLRRRRVLRAGTPNGPHQRSACVLRPGIGRGRLPVICFRPSPRTGEHAGQ